MNLSKEKIEKAKQELNKFCKYDDNLFLQDDQLYVYQDSIEILLKYIQEIEQENKKLNKMIDEMLIHISKISDCPLEVYDIDLECDKECGKISEQECWRKYYKEKVEE